MTKRRKKAADLEHWLAGAATPLFVLDGDQRLSAFNAGCEALTGWAANDVVGEKCHYVCTAETPPATALAASLCPPPEVFAGAELAAPAHIIRKTGSPLPRLLHFYPLRDDEDRIHGVLGIILPLDQPRAAPDISPARQLHAELADARHSLSARFGPGSLIAKGPAMRKVLVQLELARQSGIPVLLQGEPGAGKEHLARLIHITSPDHGDWFVPLDCRRLSADELERVWLRLIETHRPTSRGGAPQPGTVYLSDVERLPRELQERIVKAFAPNDPTLALRLRLLASTTVDLQQPEFERAVRTDFLAMISPLSIRVPSLREREGDLPLLAQHFLEECNRQDTRQIGGFEETVWPLLLRYQWPGNVDELAAVVRDAHAHAAAPLIRADDLPFRFRTALEAQDLPPPAAAHPLPLDALLTRVETQLITLALERCRNNKTKAAEMLGIHRARLIRRIEQLHLAEGNPDVEASEPQNETADRDLKDESHAE
jgi:DNA-binding NtrC family response regulator